MKSLAQEKNLQREIFANESRWLNWQKFSPSENFQAVRYTTSEHAQGVEHTCTCTVIQHSPSVCSLQDWHRGIHFGDYLVLTLYMYVLVVKCSLLARKGGAVGVVLTNRGVHCKGPLGWHRESTIILMMCVLM